MQRFSSHLENIESCRVKFFFFLTALTAHAKSNISLQINKHHFMFLELIYDSIICVVITPSRQRYKNVTLLLISTI